MDERVLVFIIRRPATVASWPHVWDKTRGRWVEGKVKFYHATSFSLISANERVSKLTFPGLNFKVSATKKSVSFS